MVVDARERNRRARLVEFTPPEDAETLTQAEFASAKLRLFRLFICSFLCRCDHHQLQDQTKQRYERHRQNHTCQPFRQAALNHANECDAEPPSAPTHGHRNHNRHEPSQTAQLLVNPSDLDDSRNQQHREDLRERRARLFIHSSHYRPPEPRR